MSIRVILQPAASREAMQHYHDTVESPVRVERIRRFIPDAEQRRLEPVLAGRHAIPVWGVVPGLGRNIVHWNVVQPGDVCLFSRPGGVFAAATVVGKTHSAPLALDLWGRDPKGETWEYVYFLDELLEVDIPYAQFNPAVGYAPRFAIQGFRVLNEDLSERLLATFDLASSTTVPAVGRDEYLQAVRAPVGPEASNRDVTVKARTEQGFLRNLLFGDHAVAGCCMCGRSLPVGLLVAAHLKRRAECTVQEMNDYEHIVAPMCRLGCDELYERGYISVDPQGTVTVLPGAPTSPDLTAATASLQGRRCSAWGPGTLLYFGQHYRKASLQGA